MKFPKLQTFLVLIICCTSLQARNINLDSLKQVVAISQNKGDQFKAAMDLGWYYRTVQLDSAFYYTEYADDITTEVERAKKAEIYYNFGVINRYKGAFNKSIEYYQKNLEINQDLNNLSGIAKAHYGLSTAHLENKDMDNALLQSQKSKDIFSAEADTFGMLRAINLIGIILKDVERPHEAEAYFLEAISYAKAINNVEEQAHFYGNLGSTYTDLKEYKKAIEHYQKALKIDVEQNNQWGVSAILENLGRVYNKQKNYQEAEHVLTQALDIKLKLNHTKDIASLKDKLGYAKGMNGKYEEGIKLLEESKEMALANNFIDTKILTYTHLADIYNKNGKYELAVGCMREERDLLRESWKENLQETVVELNTKYETIEKEQEIASLNSAKEISSLQLKSAQRTTATLAGIALLFIALFFWLRNLYKKILVQDKEKEILLKEIHHRVKNNLQFISSLLNLQSQHIDDPTALDALKEGQDRVKSMALIHQNLYQEKNLTGVELKKYFEKLISNLFHSYNINDNNVQLHMDVDNLNLDVDSVIPLGLIVNELVSNSLKYAFPDNKNGSIKVSLKEANEMLVLTVSDDGIGFENEKEILSNNSFGYKLINAFKDQLEADMKIKNENGLSISLLINDYKKVA